MAWALSATVPASSRFIPLDRFRPAATKRPLVVGEARPKDGPRKMNSDAKLSGRLPAFGRADRSGREDSKGPAHDGGNGVGRSNRSGLTAEKAKVLRRKLRAMESWHDAMYHSAIASRLALPDHP